MLHHPAEQPTLKSDSRDAIRLAVAKARAWMDDFTYPQAFGEIDEIGKAIWQPLLRSMPAFNSNLSPLSDDCISGARQATEGVWHSRAGNLIVAEMRR